MYTVRTYSDTNATRYPQYQYCISILADTPGVALAVSVQSPLGFLTRLDIQHRFDACLKHYLLRTGGGIPYPPALNRSPHCCVHARFGVYRTTMQCLEAVAGVNTLSVCRGLLTYRSTLVDRGIPYRQKYIYEHPLLYVAF